MTETSEVLEKPTILVVDDTPDNLTVMSGLLKDLYKVKIANSGERALKVAASSPAPDLVLLDIMMPGMDGYQVLRQLRTEPQTRDIPAIFLTAKTEVDDERMGLELGAVDYITKPISPPIVLARVKNHLDLKRMRDFLKSKNAYLEEEVANRTQEVMNRHTMLGHKSLEQAEAQLGTQVGFLTMAKEIALSHQEKWDGTRYPQGLSGDQISISARLMALADVYDALISKRVYKPPFTHEEARDIIVEGRGKHFDPDIVDAFIAVQVQFRAIADEHADHE